MANKGFTAVLVSIVLAAVAYPWNAGATDLTLNNAPAKVYFSPAPECVKTIVQEIDNAAMEVLVQASSFSSPQIARALQGAAKRAVSVEVILDRSQRSEKYVSALFLTNWKVPAYVDGSHAFARDNVLIIDKTTVITGSFNFRRTADGKDMENILLIRSKDLAGPYLDNWLKHKAHSEPYRKKSAAPAPRRRS